MANFCLTSDTEGVIIMKHPTGESDDTDSPDMFCSREGAFSHGFFITTVSEEEEEDDDVEQW